MTTDTWLSLDGSVVLVEATDFILTELDSQERLNIASACDYGRIAMCIDLQPSHQV